MSSHPEQETLIRLVKGELETARGQAVLDHLTDCESCLEAVSRAWDENPGMAEALRGPGMDPRTGAQIELRLFGRIHTAELSNRISWLVTAGFLSVLLVLLQPVLGSRKSISEEV